MRSNKAKISVVVPVFNEEGNIAILAEKLVTALSTYADYEIIFVDDGSTDKTLSKIKNARVANKKISFISFSRNFGHQNALRAGLDYATGSCVISIDGDLQHPVELIPKMVAKWREGFDIVYTIRKEDSSLPFLKKKTAKAFYWLMNKITDIKITQGAADFRLLDQSVVDVLKTITEGDLFIRGAISWLGFRQYGIEYMPKKRNHGQTKYTFKRMIKFAASGITGFSVRPLQISTFLGFIFALVAFIYGSYAIYVKLFTGDTISGWASVLTAILFIGGIQMVMIGILGEYLGKVFIETKKRPNYIIKEKSGD